MKLSRNVPLNAMRVLESAARHLSFTKAGEELGMTQTAVSYQIKLLEAFIGAPLFLRKPRQVALTQTGELLAGRATQALGILATAMEEARNRTADVLVISCTTTFAHQWLARRLGVFQARYPKISLQLCLSNEIVDFAHSNVDIGIRWGKGDWPGVVGRRIMRLDFAPVVSPTLAETIGGLKHPVDILKLPIISPNDRWWKHWFAEAGVTETDLDSRTGSDFGIQNLEAQAAIAGHGVAIVNPVHFAEDIASGRLLQPFELVCNDGHDYWIVHHESRRNVTKIKIFTAWMEEEFPTEM